MAAPYTSKLQMDYLGGGLSPSNKKKPKKPTQGKVVPVMKKASPYKPISVKKPTSPSLSSSGNPSVNAMGVAAQQQAMANRNPVSTQLNVSYESDPVLARIRALGTQDVANARSEADSLRKKAIIDSGLTDVGAEIGVDQNTLQAAGANPFSTAALLKKEQAERGRQLDESLNSQNLFYGGYRAQQLQDLASSGAQQQTALTGDIRDLLGGISGGVTDAEQAAAQAEQAAMEQAAEEARMAALQQSYLDAIAAANAPPDIGSALGATAPGNPLVAESGVPFTDQQLLAAIDPQYMPEWAAPPTPYAATMYEPNQFISTPTAQAAGVNPYFYDPYEEAYAQAIAQNQIAGQLGYF
jgi:hypothetical protein